MKFKNRQQTTVVAFALLFLSILLFPYILNSATYKIPKEAASIYVADKDLDGDLDIIVGHKTAWEQTNPTISILENDGKGLFPNIDTMHVYCGYQEDIFLQKINDDEYPDIVTFYSDFSTGSAERFVRLIENNNGLFETYHDFSLNSDQIFSGINYGDIDDDGDTDIVFCSNNSHFWGWMKNDGAGQFANPGYFELDFPPYAISCGDINNDGTTDTAIGNGGRLSIFYRDIIWGIIRKDYETYIDATNLAVFDINNDNKNELIIVDGLLKKVRFTEPDNDGNLNEFYTKRISGFAISFIISDLNNDNFADVTYNAAYSDTTYVLYNEKGDSLAGPVKFQTYFGDTSNYTNTIKSSIADIDGNGLKDIVALNSSYAFENDVTILFQTEEGDFVQDPQTGIENQDNLVCKTELYQNYPNPFNNETHIQFSLVKASQIELSIVNSKGEFVQNLVSSKLNKGKHSISFKADDINSGLYFYRLSVDGVEKDAKKMLYLK